jgi:signal transduction histidine kinase/CheY-like chemotaxis protein
MNNENENIRRNGERVWIAWTNKAIVDQKGRISEILSIGMDITKRRTAEKETKNLEAQLRKAQKMEAIGTLAGGIAHDFNNILSAVFGYTEMALDKASEGTTLQGYMREVLTAGHRARDLVKQILAFSRQAEQEVLPVQVKLIAKEVIRLLRASLPTTIEIRRNFQNEQAVLADPTQIYQVLMNLCTNAGHAMRKKGGILEISLTNVELDTEFVGKHPGLEPGPYLRLTVDDSGLGMPADVMERIFDPYFTTKVKGGGTGLGLAVVHGIVKDRGGTITVDSEPGKGATFHVYLPVIEGKAKPAAKTNLPLALGDEHILFIDDEEAIAELGKEMLERCGYKVTTLTSGIEALELFKARPDKFDLVITDLTMPNMTGKELAKEVLHDRPQIPVILCTGFSEMITEKSAKAMGIRAFLMKPLTMHDLAGTVRKLLDESRS